MVLNSNATYVLFKFNRRDLFGGEGVEVVHSNIDNNEQNGNGRVNGVGNNGAGGTGAGGGTIELVLRLASISIRCHGKFDVYPKPPTGDCEPLISIHTTTVETIYLHEVRACDDHNGDCSSGDYDSSIAGSSGGSGGSVADGMGRDGKGKDGGGENDNNNNNNNNNNNGGGRRRRSTVLVLKEKKTETSGKRILSIRPATYKSVESWSTPS